MKTSEILLGICALLIATGSAFASLDLTTYQIRVDRGDGVPGPNPCPEQNNVCVSFTDSDACTGGASNCTVNVNSGAFTARLRDSSCNLITTGNDTEIATHSDACIIGVD